MVMGSLGETLRLYGRRACPAMCPEYRVTPLPGRTHTRPVIRAFLAVPLRSSGPPSGCPCAPCVAPRASTIARLPVRRATVANPVGIEELRQLAAGRFGDMVKGVIDLERAILLLDADLHADQEAVLLAEGSRQMNLWGINLYPDVAGSEWLEFDSLINLRPSFGNRSRGVDEPATREAITALVERLVRR